MVGIDEATAAASPFSVLNAYPNPANSKLTVAYNSLVDVEVVMTNLLGQEVKRIKGDTSTKGIQHTVIDLTSVSKGVYFITIDSGNHIRYHTIHTTQCSFCLDQQLLLDYQIPMGKDFQ